MEMLLINNIFFRIGKISTISVKVFSRYIELAVSLVCIESKNVNITTFCFKVRQYFISSGKKYTQSLSSE
jgi:hypothetical protein